MIDEIKRAKHNAYAKKYRELHKEEIYRSQKLWRDTHKDELNERRRLYRESHRKELAASSREYNRTHKEHVAKRDREKYIRKKDLILKKMKEYYNSHTDETKERVRKYRKTPDGKLMKSLSYHKRRVNGKNVENTLTLAQWKKIVKLQDNRCNICKRKFGKRLLAVRDHIIPLSKGGGLTFENVQALCNKCNSTKHAKLDKSFIITWAQGVVS